MSFVQTVIDSGRRILKQPEEFSIEEQRILDLLDRGLSQDFPNPGRVGCPGPSLLRGIAQHKVPLSQADRWLNHLSSCSPCFQDFRMHHAEAVVGKRRVFQMALATAALVLIIIGGLLLVRSRAPLERATVTIDLRQHAIARGENQADTGQPPLELSRRTRHLVLDLPIGSKEGSYEVGLLGGGGEEIRSTRGVAQLENHLVILSADIDLAGVSPGSYLLGVRQPGLEWSRYPVRVK